VELRRPLREQTRRQAIAIGKLRANRFRPFLRGKYLENRAVERSLAAAGRYALVNLIDRLVDQPDRCDAMAALVRERRDKLGARALQISKRRLHMRLLAEGVTSAKPDDQGRSKNQSVGWKAFEQAALLLPYRRRAKSARFADQMS
jgi:hypothetical protein